MAGDVVASWSTMDDPGLLTLTEAAARSGHTRVALRQRVRRGTLPHVKDNEGVIRIKAMDLADLPPPSPDDQEDDPGQTGDDPGHDALASMADALAAAMADVAAARANLDRSQAERMADHGRAERAEAARDAEGRRADAAEARAREAGERLAVAEAELRESRRPLWERVVRVLRAG